MQQTQKIDDNNSFWPIFQQQDTIKNKFWDPPCIKQTVHVPLLLFQRELIRIGTHKKTVKTYLFEVYDEGLFSYQERGQMVKGQLNLNPRIYVNFLNGFTFLKIQRYQNVFITLMTTDKTSLLNLYYVLKMFCTGSGFSQDYNITKYLGCGAFGQVYKVEDQITKQKYAAKIYLRKDFEGNDLRNLIKTMIISEVEILLQIKKTGGHQNIVQLHQIYQETNEFIIIQELLQGQDLYDIVKIQKGFSEQKTASIILQIAKALEYIHNLGFVHRDIKLDNIIQVSQQNETVKLIDFGFAEKIQYDRLTSRCGTPGYVPPEVLKKQPYTEKSDVFSLGVVLYILITGKALFKGNTITELLTNNKKCQPQFNQEVWQTVSKECKILVKKMLTRNPKQRCSIVQVINDDWFKNIFLKQSIYLSSLQQSRNSIKISPMNSLKQSYHSSYNKRSSSKNLLSSAKSMISLQSSECVLDFKVKVHSLMMLQTKVIDDANIGKIQSQSQVKDDEEIKTINQSIKQTRTLVEKIQDLQIIQDSQIQRKTNYTSEAIKFNSQDIESFDYEDDDSMQDRHLVLFRHAERVFNRNKKPYHIFQK